MERLMTVAALALFSLAAASAVGGASDDQKLRALTRKVERLERDARDLTKTSRALDKALAAARKEASAVRKAVKALDERSDKRTIRLAEWFDIYHGRDGQSRFHRERIRYIK